jgi:hypothetical protein
MRELKMVVTGNGELPKKTKTKEKRAVPIGGKDFSRINLSAAC